MPDREPLGDGILPFQDMNVGAADRRRGDPDQGIERSNIRDRLLVEHDAVRFHEDGGLHFRGHGVLLLDPMI
jgi:hypothetical protein